MTITKDEVVAIARLARIEIDHQNIPGFATELSQILEFVQQMDKVDTQNVEPLAHPLELDTHLRPDVVLESNQRESYQANAPQVDRSHYLVPKVIE